MALKQKAKVRFLPFNVYVTVDPNLCFARSCSVFGIGKDVCCTSLQRAEDVFYQLRRRLPIMVAFKKTLINNSFVRERVFCYFNERFVSNRTGDIQMYFFRGGLWNAFEINISQATCQRVQNSELFLEVISK